MLINFQFGLSCALGARPADGMPFLVEAPPESEFDQELVFFYGLEIFLPFLTIYIGKLEGVEPL